MWSQVYFGNRVSDDLHCVKPAVFAVKIVVHSFWISENRYPFETIAQLDDMPLEVAVAELLVSVGVCRAHSHCPANRSA